MKSKFKTQTVTIPNTSTSGIYERRFALDKDYLKVKSAYVVERSNGGAASNYRIGFRTESGAEVRDLAPKECYTSGTNIPIADRFIPMDIEANGRNVIVRVEAFATLTADITFDVVYEQVNED